jgi:hypothetical protein
MKVLTFPLDVLEVGWKPADLMLGPLRDLSEERVAAAIGAPLSWLGLGSGLESDSNKATRSVVDRQALFGFTLPLMQHLEKQLTEALVPELGEPGDTVEFDRMGIASYRQYLLEQIAEGDLATGGPTVTVNEFRTTFLGMDEIEGGDELRGVLQGEATDQESSKKPKDFSDEEDQEL